MPPHANSRVKALVKIIVHSVELNHSTWYDAREQLRGVLAACKALGTNEVTWKCVEEGIQSCFDLGHGMTIN